MQVFVFCLFADVEDERIGYLVKQNWTILQVVF